MLLKYQRNQVVFELITCLSAIASSSSSAMVNIGGTTAAGAATAGLEPTATVLGDSPGGERCLLVKIVFPGEPLDSTLDFVNIISDLTHKSIRFCRASSEPVKHTSRILLP